MGITQTVAPVELPVSLGEAKDHLRIDHSDEDSFIDLLIDAATLRVQDITGRQLVEATYEFTLNSFPPEIRLPKPPLSSVTSIEYLDGAGDSQTLDSADYRVISDEVVPIIDPAYGVTWPSTQDVRNAVTVTFVGGYGAAADVPSKLKLAIKMFVLDMYENRGPQSEIRLMANEAVDSLLWPERVSLFA